jgi:hypothetical protein
VAQLSQRVLEGEQELAPLLAVRGHHLLARLHVREDVR